MRVPIYMELTNGTITRLGSANIIGATAIDQTFQIPKPPASIKRILINYNYDVLSTEN